MYFWAVEVQLFPKYQVFLQAGLTCSTKGSMCSPSSNVAWPLYLWFPTLGLSQFFSQCPAPICPWSMKNLAKMVRLTLRKCFWFHFLFKNQFLKIPFLHWWWRLPVYELKQTPRGVKDILTAGGYWKETHTTHLRCLGEGLSSTMAPPGNYLGLAFALIPSPSSLLLSYMSPRTTKQNTGQGPLRVKLHFTLQ